MSTSSDPYRPPAADPIASHESAKPRPLRWACAGFLIAAAPVVLLGVWGLYQDSVYAASLPADTARCGNGALAAMMLIFPVAPFCGAIGGVIGCISALLCDACGSSSSRL